MRASIQQLVFRLGANRHIIVGRAELRSSTEYMHMYKAGVILGTQYGHA